MSPSEAESFNHILALWCCCCDELKSCLMWAKRQCGLGLCLAVLVQNYRGLARWSWALVRCCVTVSLCHRVTRVTVPVCAWHVPVSRSWISLALGLQGEEQGWDSSLGNLLPPREGFCVPGRGVVRAMK